MRSSDLTDVASAELRARNDRAAILHRSWTKTMCAQVDHLDTPARRTTTAPANELELHVDECSISMHGPAAMILATSIARKRSASTHMRAHNRGRCVTRRSNAPWLWAANSV